MANYFVYLDHQIHGPFDAVAVTQLPGFNADLRLCPEGTLNWTTAGAVAEFSKIAAAHAGATAPSGDTRECPYCSEIIKSKAVKCRFCGSSLDGRAHPAPASTSASIPAHPGDAPMFPATAGDKSRRLATVLFADMSGFTAMSRERDAEEMHEIMNALLSDLAGAVDRHGGKVDKYIGDCVMAVWGVEDTREDDAFRAATAALSMLRRVRSRAERLSTPLALHAGINTGEVIFGSIGAGSHVSRTVMGDAVNVACRLCDAAPKGEIYISESTRQRIGDRYEAQARPVHLKGVGDATAYQLIPNRRAGEHTSHRVVRSFQSRSREAARIIDALQSVGNGAARPSGMMVTGPGGVGKSRLCAHALSQNRETKILFGRCVPASPPPFAGVVSEWLSDLLEGSGAAQIERFLAAHPELESYRRDLQLVLSSDSESEQDAEEGPRTGLDRRLARFFTELSASTPLVFSAADVQWIDPFSADTIVALAESTVRESGSSAFLLLDGRPSGPVERMATAPGIERIDLNYLLPDQMREFLSNVIDGDLSAPWVENIRRRTGGVVLNLMQVLDTLAERGILQSITGTEKWRLAGAPDDIPLPESLADILWRRIEHLPSVEREILMVAGVCGVSFPRQMLTVATGWRDEDIHAPLERLRDDNFLLMTAHEVSFEHGSIHEVARRMLLKTERKQIATRILDHYGERIWQAELRPLAESLHRDAGQLNALREYVAHDANRLIGIYRFDDARKLLAGIDAQGWERDCASMRARALYLNALSRLAEYEDEYDSAIDYSRQSLEIGQKLSERTIMVMSLSRLARIAFRRRSMEAARRYCEEALVAARDLADAQHISKELITLGQIAERDGRYEDAEGYYREAKSLGNWAAENPRRHVILLNSLGEAARKRGDLQSAARCHIEEYVYAREKGDERGIAYSLFSLGEVARDNGDVQAARLLTLESRDIRTRIGDRRGADYANQLLEGIATDGTIVHPEICGEMIPIIKQTSAGKT